MKPQLRLAFSDFWPQFEPEQSFLVRALADRYDVHIDPDAEILVHGPYGTSHVTHRGTKVLVTAEPWPPPERAFDYCISYRESTAANLRLPPFQWALIDRPGLADEAARPPELEEWARRPHFCSFVYSNEAPRERAAFFRELSARRFVHAPGAQCNNAPPLRGGRHAADFKQAKLDYERSFRFSIAFENSSLPGYTTEKLLDSLAAGTIPIYWGNPDVGDDFPDGGFIRADAFESFAGLADFVVELDADPGRAAPYLQAPRRPVAGPAEVCGGICDFFAVVAGHEPTFGTTVVRPVVLTLRDGAPALARRGARSIGSRTTRFLGRR
jgi:hypothetical protein